MADNQYPTVYQKVAIQMHLSSSISQDVHARYRSIQRLALSQRRFQYGNYSMPHFRHAKPHTFATDFLMGGVSAVVSKTTDAPIERVKILIQNQDEVIKAGRLSEPYRGTGDIFRRTIKDEGFASLWRGNTANVFHYFRTQALNFALKDYFKSNLASSGGTGASYLIFVYSHHYARTRLANDAKVAKKGGGGRQFDGLVDVYRKKLKSDGVVGLYRGFNISCVGIIVFRGLYFGMYNSLKLVLLTGKMETVKRRMMMTSGEAVKYNRLFDAFNQILNEGPKSLCKGAGANAHRAVAVAGVLVGYEKLQVIIFGKK
ncbi:hypothetical protein EJD97_001176 [Solanum chilense]|uniref:ADP/ATP translocase n=1 Tax=Solanum chilense TaxID=4083 RepID=A0A6N2AR31_SOLCI|nr:hypothetical protein EJD97_001176 [Solanum chilense]